MEFPAPLKSKILENKRGAIIFKHPVCECVCIDFSRLLSIKVLVRYTGVRAVLIILRHSAARHAAFRSMRIGI